MFLTIALILVIMLGIALMLPEKNVSAKSAFVSNHIFSGRYRNLENGENTYGILRWLSQQLGVSVKITTSEDGLKTVVDITKVDKVHNSVEHFQAHGDFLAIAVLDAVYEFIRNQPTSVTPSY